ncbi:hypothetical protein CHS0354_011555 [Potamilus streckersoni]|uniref:C2H2-type domain-containing protein n=1 Tax=Potamilus streckersoni TaxID=2493646 RepID=A0AAE0SLK2_9BIVA|nr:hypothetical protein CHS0354_011555 [Potamilus streckersoni]
MGQHSDVTLDIQRAVLSLCMETYAPGTEVEIDGIICMLETQSKEYKVVKIHKTFVMSDFSVSTSTRTFQDDIVARNTINPRDDERIAKSFSRVPQDIQHRRADLTELPYHESEKSDRGKEMSRGTQNQRNRILNLRPDDRMGLENYSYTMMHPLQMDTGSGTKSSKLEVSSRKSFQNSNSSPSNNRNVKTHQKQNRTASLSFEKNYQPREVSKDLLIVVNQEAENLRQKSLTTHGIDSAETLEPETSEIILSQNTDHASESTDKGCSPSGKILAMNMSDTNGQDIKMHASFANKSFVNNELTKTDDGNDDDDDDCIFIKSEPVRASECDRSYVEISETRKTDHSSEKSEDLSPKNVSRTLWQQPDGSLIPCTFGTVDMCKDTSGMLLTTSVGSDTGRTAIHESLATSCSQGTSQEAETEEQLTHISYDRDKILNSGAFDDSIVSQTIMYSEMQNDGILGVVSKIDPSFFSPVRRGRKPCPTAPFSCERCGFRFAHRSTLHRHIKFNCGSARVACDICGKHLQRRPDAMRLHKSQVHGITEMLSMVKALQNELDC